MAYPLPDSAVELERMRAYKGMDKTQFQGWQTWKCSPADVDALELYLWTTSWTIGGAIMLPKRVITLPRATETLGTADKPDSALEQERETFYDVTDSVTFQGRQEWTVSAEDADALEDYLRATSWTVNDRVLIPHKVLVKIRTPENLATGVVEFRDSNATVRVEFETLYNPAVNPVGTATLEIQTANSYVKQTMFERADNNPWDTGSKSKQMFLPVEPDADGLFYDVADSSGLIEQLKTGSVVIVRTAYYRNAINWPMIINAQGKVNANALPNLGGAEARTMLMDGAQIPKYFLLDSSTAIVPVNFVLRYNQDKWKYVPPMLQKYLRMTVGMPKVDPQYAKDYAVAIAAGDSYDEDIYLDNNGERCGLDEAEKVSVVRNIPIGDPVECKGGLKLDGMTFTHLMALLSWMQ